jgi:hypothetical protein
MANRGIATIEIPLIPVFEIPKQMQLRIIRAHCEELYEPMMFARFAGIIFLYRR